jgi:hypothetical protein
MEYEVWGRRDNVRGEGRKERRKEGGKRNVEIDGEMLKRCERD